MVQVSCGCCSHGCCCEKHQGDGRTVKRCEYHTTHEHDGTSRTFDFDPTQPESASGPVLSEQLAALTVADARLLRNVGVEPQGIIIIDAVAEAIRDLTTGAARASAMGGVPSGELYAMLMATGISLSMYKQIIGALTMIGLVDSRDYLLRWIGPAKPDSTGSAGS